MKIQRSLFQLAGLLLLALTGCDAGDETTATDTPVATGPSGGTTIKQFSSCEELGGIIAPVIYGRPPDMAASYVRDAEVGQGFRCKWSYDRGDDPVPGSTIINKDGSIAQTRHITPDLILQLDRQRRPVADPRLEQGAYANAFLTRAEHITGGDIGTLEFKLYVWRSAHREGEAEVVSIVVRFPFPMTDPPPVPDDQQVADMLLAMLLSAF